MRRSDTATYYATFAQGFRLGGPQADVPADLCDLDGDGLIDGLGVAAPNQIDSDELDSFELGAKFSLADGRAVLNVAAYQIEWEGIPVARTADCGFGVTLNAGEAESTGIEIEGQWLAIGHVETQLRAILCRYGVDIRRPWPRQRRRSPPRHS